MYQQNMKTFVTGQKRGLMVSVWWGGLGGGGRGGVGVCMWGGGGGGIT